MIPDFKWDKDRPIPIRVSEALKAAESKEGYVEAILSVETRAGKKAITEALIGLESFRG